MRKTGEAILQEFFRILLLRQEIGEIAIQRASEANHLEIRDPTNLGLDLRQCFPAQVPTPPAASCGKLGLGQPGLVSEPANSRTSDVAGIGHGLFGIWNLKLTAGRLEKFGIQNGLRPSFFWSGQQPKFEIRFFPHQCAGFFSVVISPNPVFTDVSMTRGMISRHLSMGLLPCRGRCRKESGDECGREGETLCEPKYFGSGAASPFRFTSPARSRSLGSNLPPLQTAGDERPGGNRGVHPGI